jgi:hypothetical protein
MAAQFGGAPAFARKQTVARRVRSRPEPATRRVALSVPRVTGTT